MIETVIKCNNCGGELSKRAADNPNPVPDPKVIMIPGITYLGMSREMYHWENLIFCGPACLIAWIGKAWDAEKSTLLSAKPEAAL